MTNTPSEHVSVRLVGGPADWHEATLDIYTAEDLAAPREDPWEPTEEPSPTSGPPRARELQRLLTRAAAAIAQGQYSLAEIERITRGTSQVGTAADRYHEQLAAGLRTEKRH